MPSSASGAKRSTASVRIGQSEMRMDVAERLPGLAVAEQPRRAQARDGRRRAAAAPRRRNPEAPRMATSNHARLICTIMHNYARQLSHKKTPRGRRGAWLRTPGRCRRLVCGRSIALLAPRSSHRNAARRLASCRFSRGRAYQRRRCCSASRTDAPPRSMLADDRCRARSIEASLAPIDARRA